MERTDSSWVAMRYRKYYTVKEWKRFDVYAERVNGIDITAQEVLCNKYDIVLTDYKTAGEKRKLALQKIGHIGGVIALQSYQALKAYNSKPVKKTKTKKKSSVLHGLTGKR